MGFYLLFYFSLIYLSAVFLISKPIIPSKSGMRKPNYNKTSYLWLTGICFIFIMGLRNISVGADTYNYGHIFETLGQVGLLEKVPASIDSYWGYRLLCKLIYSLFGNQYQIFLLCIAAITVTGVFRFIYYSSENYIASVLLFVVCYMYFNSWNVSRQCCALAIGVNAAIELFRNKKIRSILLVILACSFHNAAIVFMLIYPLKLVRWNKKIFAVYTLCLVAATGILEYLIQIFCIIFPRYQSIYIKFITTGITTSFGSLAQGRKMLVSLFFLCIIIAALIIVPEKEHKKGFMSDWFVMAMIMVEIVIGIIFRKNNVILRFQLFFTIFVIVGIPNLIERLNFNRKNKIILNLIVIAVLTIPFVIQLKDNYGKIVPYSLCMRN